MLIGGLAFKLGHPECRYGTEEDGTVLLGYCDNGYCDKSVVVTNLTRLLIQKVNLLL